MIKAGIVSTVDPAHKTVRITLPDRDNGVSGDLIVPIHVWDDLDPPAVGDKAACAFIGTGIREGFVIGFY